MAGLETAGVVAAGCDGVAVVATGVVAAGVGVLELHPVMINALINRIAMGTNNFFTFSSFFCLSNLRFAPLLTRTQTQIQE